MVNTAAIFTVMLALLSAAYAYFFLEELLSETLLLNQALLFEILSHTVCLYINTVIWYFYRNSCTSCAFKIFSTCTIGSVKNLTFGYEGCE